jgi:hypothetical protein
MRSDLIVEELHHDKLRRSEKPTAPHFPMRIGQIWRFFRGEKGIFDLIPECEKFVVVAINFARGDMRACCR